MNWDADITELQRTIEAIERILAEDPIASVKLLDEYFDPNGRFSGAWFERLEEHGPYEIGCHDILALNLLDLPLGGRMVRDLLLDESLKRSVHQLLREIHDEDLWLASESSLDSADELWRMLDEHANSVSVPLGDAGLSKLLARKRPRLIPISDSVVVETVPVPREIGRWRAYRTIFRNRSDLTDRLKDLRNLSRHAQHASLLRVLDVMVWRQGRPGGSGRPSR